MLPDGSSPALDEPETQHEWSPNSGTTKSKAFASVRTSAIESDREILRASGVILFPGCMPLIPPTANPRRFDCVSKSSLVILSLLFEIAPIGSAG